MIKKLVTAAVLSALCIAASVASATVIQGQVSAGVYTNIGTDSSGNLAIGSIAAENYTITQTAVTVTATSGQLIAANPARKYLAWMVIGTADVTCTPGASAAVVGVGFVYQASGINKQGSSQEFPHGTPTTAFQCIAAATGSIVYVWEGN